MATLQETSYFFQEKLLFLAFLGPQQKPVSESFLLNID